MSERPKVSILLVDDRPENLISLAAVLDRDDYRLVSATSGKEALRHLLREDFALILLDVQMPEMDGFETAVLIRERAKTREVPIIFLTAINKDEAYVFKGYEVGAVDYVFKPFDPHILRSKVAVFAEMHRRSLIIQEQQARLREADQLRASQERARYELESLRRERAIDQRYRDLVEGIHDGIVWVFDPATRRFTVISSRAEEVLGFPRAAWETDPGFWERQIHPDDMAAAREAFKEGIATGKDFSLEYRIARADGSWISFHASVRVVPSDDGKGVAELRGLSIDITRLRMAQEEADEAIRVRDEFLSIASHELKTPLTPLKLQLQTLKALLARNPDYDTLVKRVHTVVVGSDRQVDRIVKLIEELLDVSRINHGKLQLYPERIDFDELLGEIVQRFAGELTQAGCEVAVDVEEGLEGDWDRLRMEQVVINLLTNAIKYGRGKPIRIEARRAGDRLEIRVKDHGIGISSDDQARIFDRFERAVSSAHFGGLGLGLYIVNHIVNAHGGSISVESEPGHGSVFTATIPFSVPVQSLARDQHAPEARAEGEQA